jgi:hypothetical protein
LAEPPNLVNQFSLNNGPRKISLSQLLRTPENEQGDFVNGSIDKFTSLHLKIKTPWPKEAYFLSDGGGEAGLLGRGDAGFAGGGFGGTYPAPPFGIFVTAIGFVTTDALAGGGLGGI